MKNHKCIKKKMRELAQIQNPCHLTSKIQYWMTFWDDIILLLISNCAKQNVPKDVRLEHFCLSLLFATCWVLLYLPFWFVWDFPFAGKGRCEWRESIAKRAKTALRFSASFDIFTFRSRKVSGNRRNNQIPWMRKVSRNRKNDKIPGKQNCLKTGEITKPIGCQEAETEPLERYNFPLYSPVSRHLWTLDWCWIRSPPSWVPQAQSKAWEVYQWKTLPFQRFTKAQLVEGWPGPSLLKALLCTGFSFLPYKVVRLSFIQSGFFNCTSP